MIVVACALALSVKVHLIWDPTILPVPADLPSMLGSRYEVSRHLLPGTTFSQAAKTLSVTDAKIVFILLGSVESQDAGWNQERNRILPAIKLMANRIRNWPSHPKVMIGIPSLSAYAGSYVDSLIKQAAREIGVSTISLSKEWAADNLYEAVVNPRIDKAGWRVVSADSQQPDEGSAKAAIDGDPETYWHTRYDPRVDRPPHELIVNLGETMSFDGFRYLPRQDGGVNGRVKEYALYLSLDGKDWGDPVSEGVVPDTIQATRIRFPSTKARFFRFVAKSEVNGGPWTSVAEIDLIRAR